MNSRWKFKFFKVWKPQKNWFVDAAHRWTHVTGWKTLDPHRLMVKRGILVALRVLIMPSFAYAWLVYVQSLCVSAITWWRWPRDNKIVTTRWRTSDMKSRKHVIHFCHTQLGKTSSLSLNVDFGKCYIQMVTSMLVTYLDHFSITVPDYWYNCARKNDYKTLKGHPMLKLHQHIAFA